MRKKVRRGKGELRHWPRKDGEITVGRAIISRGTGSTCYRSIMLLCTHRLWRHFANHFEFTFYPVVFVEMSFTSLLPSSKFKPGAPTEQTSLLDKHDRLPMV